MGSALVKGWLRSPEGQIRFVVWDKVEAATARLLETGRVERAESLEDLAGRVDAVLVVVKPKDANEVLAVLAGLLSAEQTVISSMAGVTLEWMRGILGPGPTLFRIMPNLGVELGVGAVALAHEPGASGAEVQSVRALLQPLGLVEVLPENQFDAVTGVSGSGPAFLALAIESLEDGAVAVGLSRALARRLVRQTALATAELFRLAERDKVAVGRESLAWLGTLMSAADRLDRGQVEAAVGQGQTAVHGAGQVTQLVILDPGAEVLFVGMYGLQRPKRATCPAMNLA